MYLSNVTARVSHRAQLPPKEKDAPRKDPAVHVSLSSDSIVKQQSRQTVRHRNGQIPKRKTLKGLKTRKTLPTPAKLRKLGFARREGPQANSEKTKVPRSQIRVRRNKQRRFQWRPYMAPTSDMSTRKNSLAVSSRFYS